MFFLHEILKNYNYKNYRDLLEACNFRHLSSKWLGKFLNNECTLDLKFLKKCSFKLEQSSSNTTNALVIKIYIKRVELSLPRLICFPIRAIFKNINYTFELEKDFCYSHITRELVCNSLQMPIKNVDFLDNYFITNFKPNEILFNIIQPQHLKLKEFKNIITYL